MDRKGSLRPVEGVAGAFLLGAAVDHDVVSAAHSGKSLVVKKDRELIVDGTSFEAVSGAVVVTFTPGGSPMKSSSPKRARCGRGGMERLIKRLPQASRGAPRFAMASFSLMDYPYGFDLEP